MPTCTLLSTIKLFCTSGRPACHTCFSVALPASAPRKPPPLAPRAWSPTSCSKPFSSPSYLAVQVLCACSEAGDKVVPVSPPDAAAVGERVMVVGYEQQALEEVRGWCQRKREVELQRWRSGRCSRAVVVSRGAPLL